MGSTNGAALNTPPPVEDAPAPRIMLAPLEVVTAIVPIQGVTPVIPHKWSEKSKGMMRHAQSGSKVKAKHDPKIPHDEADAATYYLDDGVTPGIPATAFKAAIVGGTRLFNGITMTQARTCFFVEGEGPFQLVALDGERHLREDTPRNSNGIADLRYRYAYWPWSTLLRVQFLPSQVDLASVLALINAGGLGGVGDWRPSAPKSNTGTYGRFEIVPEAQIEIEK